MPDPTLPSSPILSSVYHPSEEVVVESYPGDDACKSYNSVNGSDILAGVPFSQESRPNLTDAYQIRMAYAYWKSGRHEAVASFEVFFRKAPFGGSFCVLGGIDEVIRAINVFKFKASDFKYMRDFLNITDEGFFKYLDELTTERLTLHAQKEGSIVFAKTPLLQVTGPLILCQLIETLVLNLMNFPSLIATNALRMRLEAGENKKLVEFGLRRAQGPDGAMSASRYSYIGGFDGTSNVRAGEVFGLPVFGTHAHSFVTTYSPRDLSDEDFQPSLSTPAGEVKTFKEDCVTSRAYLFEKCPWLGENDAANDGEFMAFIVFAAAYPEIFIALVDTFDTIASGLPNYIAVAITLQRYLPGTVTGLRLDSGDLAYLSKTIRDSVNRVAEELKLPDLCKTSIFASNDINEKVLRSLNKQNHEIDSFGIGTNLVTCQAQPALGLVYKMTSIDGEPKIKLSENTEKSSVPFPKMLHRLYNADGVALMDYVQRAGDEAPKAGERVFAHHLTNSEKRCYVIPARVEEILIPVWNGMRCDGRSGDYPQYLLSCRDRATKGIKAIRPDVIRAENPSMYKVSTSKEFYDECDTIKRNMTPIKLVM